MPHLYAPQYRPPGFSTVPAGFEIVAQGSFFLLPMRPDLPVSAPHRFGVISYERRLTDDECREYQLQPANL